MTAARGADGRPTPPLGEGWDHDDTKYQNGRSTNAPRRAAVPGRRRSPAATWPVPIWPIELMHRFRPELRQVHGE
jgi:hypothetical protein